MLATSRPRAKRGDDAAVPVEAKPRSAVHVAVAACAEDLHGVKHVDESMTVGCLRGPRLHYWADHFDNPPAVTTHQVMVVRLRRATPIPEFSVLTAKDVHFSLVDHPAQRAVDRRQTNPFTGGAQPSMQLLRRSERLDIPQDVVHRTALPRGPPFSHRAIVLVEPEIMSNPDPFVGSPS